jgi:hypothetical protein
MFGWQRRRLRLLQDQQKKILNETFQSIRHTSDISPISTFKSGGGSPKFREKQQQKQRSKSDIDPNILENVDLDALGLEELQELVTKIAPGMKGILSRTAATAPNDPKVFGSRYVCGFVFDSSHACSDG